MKLVVTNYELNNKSYYVELLIDDEEILDIYVNDSFATNLVGTKTVGKVEKVIESPKSVFVKTKFGSVYLPYDNDSGFLFSKKCSKKNIACNDELWIEIVKEAIKTKKAVATNNISFKSKHFIITYGQGGVRYSAKLSDDYVEKIKDTIESVVFKNDDVFSNSRLTVRTSAKDANSTELLEDLEFLVKDVLNFYKKYNHAALYDFIQDGFHFENYLREYNDLGITLITDLDEVYSYCLSKNVSCELLKYVDDYPLNKLYQIPTIVDNLLKKKVYLKSNANIIFEELETLTFIDVNSANNTLNNSFLDLNTEALSTILKQIKLRNISGMILCDFINMSKEENEIFEKRIAAELKKYNDIKFHDITKLGLVEFTRKKQRNSLKNTIKMFDKSDLT